MTPSLFDETEQVSREQLMNALPALVFVERAGRIVFANHSARHILGVSRTEQFDRPANEVFWGLYPGVAEPLGQGKVSQPQETFECRLLAADNRFVPVHGSYRITDPTTREAMVIALPAPPTEQPRSAFLDEVLSSAPEAVAITHGTRVLHINPAFTRLFGYTPEEVGGKELDQLILPETRRHEPEILQRAVEAHGRASMETVRQAKDGELIDVSLLMAPMVLGGSRIGYYSSFRDIRERKQIEAKLQHDALHDVLTGLANRVLFLDRLQLAIARKSRRPEAHFAVLFLDLDRFKDVNDTLGHASGDQVLMSVANRLRASFRPQDTVARIGGDEFAVLLENICSLGDIRSIAERLTTELSEPMTVFGHQVTVIASVGVAFGSPEHILPEQALRDADYAMYRAKQQGGSRFEIFDNSMQVDVTAQQQKEQDLRTALENREFDVWYQPVYRLSDLTLEGFEALLRWRRPDGSHVPFLELLPLAEETGMLISIGKDVLERACIQMREWLDRAPNTQITMSVNLSPRQFTQPDIVDIITTTLRRTGLPPSCLRIEVAEAALNHRPDAAICVLQRVVDVGVRIALDNFGSGLAAMNHLVRLPIDVVKIDRRLIACLPARGRHAALLDTLFDLGSALRVQMLAEGIENLEQLEALRNFGCELGQGHLFSTAVTPERAFKLIERGHWTDEIAV